MTERSRSPAHPPTLAPVSIPSPSPPIKTSTPEPPIQQMASSHPTPATTRSSPNTNTTNTNTTTNSKSSFTFVGGLAGAGGEVHPPSCGARPLDFTLMPPNHPASPLTLTPHRRYHPRFSLSLLAAVATRLPTPSAPLQQLLTPRLTQLCRPDPTSSHQAGEGVGRKFDGTRVAFILM
jgi:hypothetical protein